MYDEGLEMGLTEREFIPVWLSDPLEMAHLRFLFLTNQR
jgi:hypothetical protein